MIYKFERACEAISGERFKNSPACYILAGFLIFLLGSFGYFLIKTTVMFFIGGLAEVSWSVLVFWPVFICLYYYAVIGLSWVFIKLKVHKNI